MLSSTSSHVLTAQGFALHAESRRACVLRSARRCLVHEPACSSHGHTSFATPRRCCPARRAQTLRRAAPQDASGSDTSGEFDLSLYVEAKVERVDQTNNNANVLLLKLLDGRGCILPVYIGDAECQALLMEMHRTPSSRPLTHDLMKNSLEMLGYRVTKIRLTCLVSNTYIARMHYAKGRRSNDDTYHEVDVDCRPSDAINMAIRFNTPIYVHNTLVKRMADQPEKFKLAHTQTSTEIIRSCKEMLMHFPDPTVCDKLHLQLAIAEERYDDATMLKDRIEGVLNTDRTVRLVVQLEAALHDSRLEEAAQLRDELSREYDVRAAAESRQKQQLDL